MKLISLFALLFLSFNSLATDTVRYDDPGTGILQATTNTSIQLFAESPSSGGKTENTAGKVYVPFDIQLPTLGTSQSNYFNTNAGAVSTFIFGFNSSVGSIDTVAISGETTLKNYFISFPLKVTVGGTIKYLHLSAKKDSNYIVVSGLAGGQINVTDGAISLAVSPQAICKVEGTNCSDFDQAGTPAAVTKTINLYFFLADSLLSATSDIGATPDTTYPEGLFFQLNISSKVFTPTDITVSLSDLRKGDRRILGSFSSTATMTASVYRETLAFIHSATVPGCLLPGPISGCSGTLQKDNPISTSQSGDFTLNNLVNGKTYAISLGFLDKYGFMTALSNFDSQTPTEIQELLKKQACYILTAGFGEEHYVTNYFRSYRDHILANSWLGRKFIKVYYRSAPHYAMIIYKNEWMRLVIRSAAYTLYFLFNFYWVVLIFLGACLFFNLWKIKILLHNNRL
jgi:hypothetical protein